MSMELDTSRSVKVYRNLKHGKNAKPLYSIMQDGKVKARRHQVLLSSAAFIVLESGRQRVLQQKRKNVHAFVIGKLAVNGAMGIDEHGPDLPWKVRYNPYEAGHFIGQEGEKLEGAGAVLLNERGMSAAYTY